MRFPLRFPGSAAFAAAGFAALICTTITPQTAQAQVIEATDRGWYDNTGAHDPANFNMFAGQLMQLQPMQYRNWFVFDIPTLFSDQTYLSATLQFDMTTSTAPFVGSLAGQYASPDATETYNLCDVDTSISTLRAGGAGLTSVYNDLGTGSSYGSRTFSAADNNTTVSMTLNSTALAKLNLVAGGQFALAGFVSTLSGSANQFLFSASDTRSTVGSRLVLTASPTAAPEPGTLPLLGMGLASAGMVVRSAARRRRKTTTMS